MPRDPSSLSGPARTPLARGPREFAAQRFRVGPDEYAVFSFPFDAHWTSPSVCSRLTQAELAVTRLVLEGHGNAAIAKTRGTSARTVANQLASIFRKLEVSSRWQLAALCAAPHEAAATAPAASASSERPARSR